MTAETGGGVGRSGDELKKESLTAKRAVQIAFIALLILTAFSMVLFLAVRGVGGAADVLVESPENPKALVQLYEHAIVLTHDQIRLWFYVNVALQTASVLLGIVATLMMALQNSSNARWMKPIGIVATTLTTGIVTAYSAFHINENIDSLLKVEYDLARNSTELEMEIRETPNPTIQQEIEMLRKYTDKINELGNQRRQIMGSIGKIRTAGSQ